MPVAAVLLFSLIAGSAPALAQSSADVHGAHLLGQVAREDRRCGELSRRDLAAIGEFAMDRMAGSSLAHETLNRYTRSRLGRRGEAAIHAALGRRVAGCGRGYPAGYRRVMALTGMMGLRDQSGDHLEASENRAPGLPAAMMARHGEGGDDDEGPSAVAMVGIVAVLIAAAALALLLIGPRRRRSDPVETLRRRLAGGEIGADDYRDRLRLLEGGESS